MTPINSLSLQVEAYHGWKKELIRQISRYRNWLQDNDFFSDDVNQRIRRGMEMLLDDELTIAFVGEYSRSKTELINALFFAGYGQRMLPSQPGRTTMCPTELFYDRNASRDYLMLLPIESRTEERSLSQLRKQPEQWQRFDLDTGSPEIMQEILAEVARRTAAAATWSPYPCVPDVTSLPFVSCVRKWTGSGVARKICSPSRPN